MSKVSGAVWALSLGLSVSNVAQADTWTGLVGHWTLDDMAGSSSIADTSGGGNDGLSGDLDIGGGDMVLLDPPTLGEPGKIGGAGSFDGTDDAVRVNNVIGDTFTVAAWINTTDSGNGSPGDPPYSGHGIIWSDIGGDAADMIPMAVVAGQLAFGTGGSGAGEYDTLTSQSAVNTGVWVHVAVTRDATSGAKEVYINGNLEGSSVGTTVSLNANPYIAFGANPLDGRFFAGQIDDVYFYDRVLSVGDIAELIAGPCTPATSCPAGDDCGSVSDGCGGMLACGTCAGGQSCVANQCITVDAGAGDADSVEGGDVDPDADVAADATLDANDVDSGSETAALDSGAADSTAAADSSASRSDAEPDAGGTSTSQPEDAGGPAADVGASSGGSSCSCRTGPANGSPSWTLLASCAGVLGALRRRRRPSRASRR